MSDLPTEVARTPTAHKHTILAPEGGFFDLIESLIRRRIENFELTTDHDGTQLRWQIIPQWDEIAEDPRRPSVYHLNGTLAILLTEGEEDQQFTGSLYINVEVTAEGTPAGFLTVRGSFPDL